MAPAQVLGKEVETKQRYLTVEPRSHHSEEASRLATSALESMTAHRIPPTPMNFTVWYTYHAGHDRDLVRGLDALLANDVAFTGAENDEIYLKYFGFDRETEEIREASNRIESAIMSVLERLGEASQHTTDYGKKLTEFSGNIAKESSYPDVRKLIEGILGETRKISEKNRRLANSLEGSAKEIAVLHEQLEEVRKEALTDPLTGISNRRVFDMRLHEEAVTHQANSMPLSLLMIDIDHFKKFNDTYGHRVGDEVLKVVGRVLKDSVKGRDLPARIGGEEFAVILPATTLEDATTVAEQLRCTLSTRHLKSTRSGRFYGTITISIGAAQYRQCESIDQFLERADRALYRAKREGRNRVVAEIGEKASLGLTG